MTLMLTGCAIHYYDTETNAEHIFGFGHMVMKASAPVNTHKAIVIGTDIVGLGIGKNFSESFLSFGFDSRRRIEIIDENTTVDLVWPSSNFLETRIGSDFPLTPLFNKKTEEKSP